MAKPNVVSSSLTEQQAPIKPHDRLRAIAQRCRRHICSTIASKSSNSYHRTVADFLHQPFRSGATIESSSVTESARHLMKLLAPLLQENLTTGHRTIDRCEPIAVGIDASLRWIASDSSWSSTTCQGLQLHALLPLYLSTSDSRSPIQGQPKNSTALVECVGLLRNYMAMSLVNQLLEGDLNQWIEQHCAPLQLGSQSLNDLGIDLVSLTQLIWNHPFTSIELPSVQAEVDSAFCMHDNRRGSFWTIVDQWLSNSSHIAVPKELAIDRLSWPTLRTHFQKWLELQQQPSIQTSPDCEAIGSQHAANAPAESASQLLEECSRVVDEALGLLDESESLIAIVPSVEKNLDPASSKSNSKSASASEQIAFESNLDQSVVEIRSSSDPKLVRTLDQQLSDCRARQGSIALIVAKTLHHELGYQPEGKLAVWQRAFIDYLREQAETEELRGFVSSDGELSLLIEDVERPVVMAIAREGLLEAGEAHRQACGLGAESALALVSGISFVSSPARSFKIQQLIDSAWRCLEGATNQGSGSVKSIEVY